MKIFLATLTVLIFGVGYAGHPEQAQTGPALDAGVRNLMQAALDTNFTPGREVRIDLVQIPPNTALERHRHPGEEFHYYLEGEVEIRIEGEPTIIGTPGTTGHVPYMKSHMAVAGPKGAKILVFRVHTTGKPWRYLDTPDSTETVH
jgi:quercetin dioxygenase-like cupin family protein